MAAVFGWQGRTATRKISRAACVYSPPDSKATASLQKRQSCKHVPAQRRLPFFSLS